MQDEHQGGHESSKQYIDPFALESKRRIGRMVLIALPDKLFHGFKWGALVLVFFILSYVA